MPCSRKVQRSVGICPLPMKSRRPLKLVVLELRSIHKISSKSFPAFEKKKKREVHHLIL